MGTHHPIRKTIPTPAPVIPDKLYFRIGDVARLCEVPAYVLRFWETEFPQLKPNKGGTGQRLYRKRDVEMALRIKSLLYDQGYTIPGARQVFKTESRPADPTPTPDVNAKPGASDPSPLRTQESVATDPGNNLRREAQLRTLRDDLRSLAALLSKPVSTINPAPEPILKLTRPRLTLEPRPARPESAPPRRQGDLFPVE